MDEIKKINLTQPSLVGGGHTQRRMKLSMFKNFKIFRILLILFIILVIFGACLTFLVILPAQKVYKSAQSTYAQAKVAWTALKQQKIEEADIELKKTKEELTKTQKELESLSFLSVIPIASGYYNDADHLIKSGLHGLDAGIILVESIKPYADVLGLKGEGSFVMGSAEQRIQTAVQTMGKITPKIDEISKNLVLAKEEIDKVDPNHYPSSFGGDKIKSQLGNLKLLADEGITLVDQSRPLIKVLPALLGESKEKKYLVIFQNDKELRATGGFITAYAVFRIDKGVIHVDRSDDIYELDNSIPSKPKAPRPILEYLPKVSVLNLRDSNISPDFVESMKTFDTLYQKSSAKTNVDGIIALDTSVLVSTIKILDDEVYAAGIKFTSQTDKRCDCPQVIYELENRISRPVGYIREGRKDLLGVLLYAIMEKALKSSPKLYWGPLLQDFVTQTNQKHVLFYLYDKNAQSGIEALNVAGRIKQFEGDYFHLNQVNFAGAKSNLYVKESVIQDYAIDNDGSITKTIEVEYKNSHPPSDCDLESGGLCLNATLRNWFRVYVPKGSKLVDSKGSEVKMITYEELDKTVFEGFLTVRPLGKATLNLTYKLPIKLSKGSPLPLLIQKQPGTYNNAYTITLNKKEVEKFELLTDKQISLKVEN